MRNRTKNLIAIFFGVVFLASCEERTGIEGCIASNVEYLKNNQVISPITDDLKVEMTLQQSVEMRKNLEETVIKMIKADLDMSNNEKLGMLEALSSQFRRSDFTEKALADWLNSINTINNARIMNENNDFNIAGKFKTNIVISSLVKTTLENHPKVTTKAAEYVCNSQGIY